MKKSINSRCFLLSLVWMLLSMVSVLLFGASSPKHAHTVFTIFVCLAYGVCLYTWIRCGNKGICLYTFFLVYSFFCNCSQQLMHTCGVPDILLSSYRWVDEELTARALRYQLLCISALNLGVSIYIRRKRHCVSMIQQVENWQSSEPAVKKKDWLFWVMIACLAGVFMVVYRTYQLRSVMTYHEFMYGGSDELNKRFYFGYFFGFLSLRYVFQRRHIRLIYASWFLLVVAYMFLGTRNQAIPYISYFVITLPLTHSKWFKAKFIPLAVAGCMAFVLLMGMISSSREVLGTSLSSNSQGMAADFVRAISDVGASSSANAMTLEITRQHGSNFSYLYYLFVFFPCRTFKIPLDVVNGILPVDNIAACSSPGTYISEMAGERGLGFSYIAESFMNFKWAGFLFIILFGYTFVLMENHSYKSLMKGSFFQIAFLLVLTKGVFLARGDLWLVNDYCEYLVYTFIIYKLFVWHKKKVVTK